MLGVVDRMAIIDAYEDWLLVPDGLHNSKLQRSAKVLSRGFTQSPYLLQFTDMLRSEEPKLEIAESHGLWRE